MRPLAINICVLQVDTVLADLQAALARGGHTEVAATSWGVDVHSSTIVQIKNYLLSKEMYSKGVKSLQQDIQGDVFAEWILRFIAG
jgi:hypothetical protein